MFISAINLLILQNIQRCIKVITSAFIKLNPYWQIFGKFLRPFYWKTHPSKNQEYLFSFFKPGRELDHLLENSSNRRSENSGASQRPFYWKNHPDQMLHIKSGSNKKWMSFPVKRSVWRPGKRKFQKNFWMSFPWFAYKG